MSSDDDIGHLKPKYIPGFIWFILKKFGQLSVAKAISLSFALAIFFGSIVLFVSENFLPGNPEHRHLDYIDSLYLSASAFCVTGLATTPISKFNMLSQIALMIYIQLGGLGIIVFTMLIGLMVIKQLSRNTKLNEFISEVLDADIPVKKEGALNPKYDSMIESPKTTRLIIAIFNISIVIELIGALMLYLTMPNDIPKVVQSREFLSLFTSVSAFNNAGFSLSDDLGFLTHDTDSLYTVVILIILGGIGFPVIIFIEKLFLKVIKRFSARIEIWGETYLMTSAIRGEEPSKFYELMTNITAWAEHRVGAFNNALLGESNIVQTRIILIGSSILLFVGLAGIFCLEYNNPKTLEGLSFLDKIANSFLISAAARTAGFNTFDLAGLYDPSKFLLCLLMFIGGGPQGTAGGIKITTFVIICQYLINVISSQRVVTLFGNTISKRSVAMSIRLYILSTIFLGIAIFLLTIFHSPEYIQCQIPCSNPKIYQSSIDKIIFEVVSAFGTVGFSLGITPNLNVVEKIIYTIIMFTGRIGIFTLLIALTGNISGTSKIGETDDGIKIQVG